MIPIAKPFLGDEEARAAQATVLSGWVAQGPKVKEFEDALSAYLGSKYAAAVSSGTTALHLGLFVIGARPGDAVITVSHSFIATANSIGYCGATPIFIDIDPDTFNMSVASLESFLKDKCGARKGILYYGSARIAAIMPVHQMGMPCDLKAILRVARKFNIPVIEDAACAIGSEVTLDEGKTWEKIGRPHGDIACFSFHPRKVITTGEGGMVVTANPSYDEKVRLLRNQGMGLPASVRHDFEEIVFERYTAVGYNYRLTDIQAAIGIEQLKKLPAILSARRNIVARYKELLRDISWLRLPSVPSYCRTNWQSFAVTVEDSAPVSRDKLMQHLLKSGVSTRRGIMNIHQEPAYGEMISLKNSELARDSVVLLPIYRGMTDEDINHVVEAIKHA